LSETDIRKTQNFIRHTSGGLIRLRRIKAIDVCLGQARLWRASLPAVGRDCFGCGQNIKAFLKFSLKEDYYVQKIDIFIFFSPGVGVSPNQRTSRW
jgi:hypothetical protein